MKTIGIIGGLSWQSTQIYYEAIQKQASLSESPLNSAPLLLNSLNFGPIAAAMQQDNWPQVISQLQFAAHQLVKGGADFICLANNTLHCLFEVASKNSKVPWLNIAEPLAKELDTHKLTHLSILGTSALMRNKFYEQELQHKRGYNLIKLTDVQQHTLNKIIFDELCLGKTTPTSIQFLQKLAIELHAKGAQAIILACTELPLLANQIDSPILIFDSATLHAHAAFNLAIAQ